jgi:hypothetical protein
MAVYKVPQDVEADDKLIGPFSFRQFIYLIVVAISIAGAWGLSQLFIPLAIIPLPIIVFFAALALPLRKDQPMEAYLSAVVSFYFLKSRKRFWIPDGIDTFVTIIPPKDADRILTKDLNEDEATKRLGYLADLVDTHGWAIRGAGTAVDTSINTDLYYESQQTVDMMDKSTPQSQAMTKQLEKDAVEKKKDAIASMKSVEKKSDGPKPAAPPSVGAILAGAVPDPVVATTKTANPVKKSDDPVDDTPPVSKLPPLEKIRTKREAVAAQQPDIDARDAITYATALAEKASDERGVPVAATPAKTPISTSAATPDTGTMELTQKQADELSQRKDLSVETVGKEANRVAEQNKVLKDGDEVTISFH